MRILGDEILDTSQQCVLAPHKATHILDCMQRSMSRRSKEVILSLYYTVMRSHPVYCAQFWGPHHKKEMNVLEKVQGRAMKMIRGLTHLSYEERVKSWDCSAWRGGGSGDKEAFRDMV